ncbi:glycosyltransferase family 61 protein [Nocardioides nanhaiensis]|uniref:Glycosyltransferase 61 catalytic domain-containing protein n=1 Tax=Nocardioides nanhaiensis TaxID=1476871 RepID=A0ABP8WAA0_9ACTN
MSATRVVLAPSAPVASRRFGEEVDLVLTDGGAGDLHERLARVPELRLVVDARWRDPDRQLARWRDLFLHLADGGTWMVLCGPGNDGAVLERLRELAAQGDGRGLGRRWAEPARAIADIRAGDRRVTVTKRGHHLVKTRDADVDRVLAARAPDVAVTELASFGPAVLTPHPASTSHGDDGSVDLHGDLAAPAAHLRRYEGRLHLVEGSVVLHPASHTLLPDTYRWHLQDVPVNKRLVDVDAHVARTRRPEPVHEHLPGSYYYLDYKNPGHYGHLMTEAVSRLWGWRAAKQADPDLKLLLRRTEKHDHGRRRPDLPLLAALGIAQEDVAWMDHSVSVDSLVGVTPLWHNKEPYSAHPAIRDLWSDLRTGLPTTTVEPAPRIFVTRAATGHRACHDLAEVEQLFRGLGFTVVQPGAMSVPEQAALFAQARVVAGFGGTGMFNLAFARDVEQVVVLAHTAYDARNEHLMAAVHGVPVHYLWSEPDVPHPEGAWSYEAFQSPWTFGVDRHRATLARLLGGA